MQVSRGGAYHCMKFAKGVPLGPMTTAAESPPCNGEGGPLKQGTRITFQPDPSIFKTTLVFDFEKVSKYVHDI